MIIELPEGAARVSVRWAGPRGASDVVGHLVAANDDWYVVLPEAGPAVWVPRAEAEAVRRVPERTVLPQSRSDDLERALDAARPAIRRARLGGWRLGDHRIVAVGEPGMPVAEALEAAEKWSGRPASVRCAEGRATSFEGLGFEVAGRRVVLAGDRTGGVPGTVGLTRGAVLDLDIADARARAVAEEAGFVERYRAVVLARP